MRVIIKKKKTFPYFASDLFSPPDSSNWLFILGYMMGTSIVAVECVLYSRLQYLLFTRTFFLNEQKIQKIVIFSFLNFSIVLTTQTKPDFFIEYLNINISRTCLLKKKNQWVLSIHRIHLERYRVSNINLFIKGNDDGDSVERSSGWRTLKFYWKGKAIFYFWISVIFTKPNSPFQNRNWKS